jgi:ATP-dependent Clp protease protease subunit
MGLDYYSEFQNYAIKHMGMSGMEFYQWEQLQTQLKRSVQSSLTPYILEERELRVTQMDIFSRLMMDRIIWLAGPVNDRMSTVVQAHYYF